MLGSRIWCHLSSRGGEAEIPKPCSHPGPVLLLQLDVAEQDFTLQIFPIPLPISEGQSKMGLARVSAPSPGVSAPSVTQIRGELVAPAPLNAGLGDPPQRNPFALL